MRCTFKCREEIERFRELMMRLIKKVEAESMFSFKAFAGISENIFGGVTGF